MKDDIAVIRGRAFTCVKLSRAFLAVLDVSKEDDRLFIDKIINKRALERKPLDIVITSSKGRVIQGLFYVEGDYMTARELTVKILKHSIKIH